MSLWVTVTSTSIHQTLTLLYKHVVIQVQLHLPEVSFFDEIQQTKTKKIGFTSTSLLTMNLTNSLTYHLIMMPWSMFWQSKRFSEIFLKEKWKKFSTSFEVRHAERPWGRFAFRNWQQFWYWLFYINLSFICYQETQPREPILLWKGGFWQWQKNYLGKD